MQVHHRLRRRSGPRPQVRFAGSGDPIRSDRLGHPHRYRRQGSWEGCSRAEPERVCPRPDSVSGKQDRLPALHQVVASGKRESVRQDLCRRESGISAREHGRPVLQRSAVRSIPFAGPQDCHHPLRPRRPIEVRRRPPRSCTSGPRNSKPRYGQAAPHRADAPVFRKNSTRFQSAPSEPSQACHSHPSYAQGAPYSKWRPLGRGRPARISVPRFAKNVVRAGERADERASLRAFRSGRAPSGSLPMKGSEIRPRPSIFREVGKSWACRVKATGTRGRAAECDRLERSRRAGRTH